jgi:hypothetical protein
MQLENLCFPLSTRETREGKKKITFEKSKLAIIFKSSGNWEKNLKFKNNYNITPNYRALYIHG